MNTTKKIFFVLLCCIMAWTANAEIASGTGWNIDDDGKLTITGNINYNGTASNAPWYSYKNAITSVVTTMGATITNGTAAPTCANLFNGYTNCISMDLSNLDVSAVTNMASMFYGCSALTTLDVSNWNTANVNSISGMFKNCKALTALDLSGFNTENVNNMANAFEGCGNLISANVSNWNTGNVNNMTSMFNSCYRLTTLDVSNWNTKNVTNMPYMFGSCGGLTTLDVSNWNTANVTSMTSMFQGCSALTSLDVSNWNTEKVTNMASMFNGCKGLTTLDVSIWNTANVTNMASMFQGCSALTTLDVSNWNTEKVTNMASMFNGCKGLTTLDVSIWNTANVTNMLQMFLNCSALTTLNVSNWNTAKVINMGALFSGCSALSALNVNNWDTGNVTNMAELFSGCSTLSSLDVSNWNTSKVTSIQKMFYGCSALTTLNVSGLNTENVINMQMVFYGCQKATAIDVSNWNTAKVTTMNNMFNGCSQLTDLDIDNFSTDNVTDMLGLFQNCSALATLDVSNWNTAKVTNMASMFSGCSTLSSLDVSNWNTGMATSMANMFQNCNALTTLNVSNFNTENVTNLSSMFNGCKVLTTLNVSNWDTGKATTMGQMFQYCNGLTNLDVSNWNTANVTNMNNMFNGCIGLDSLDVSNWDTGKVTNMSNMFLTCSRLKSLDFSNWNTAKVTSKTNMLSACNALKKIKTNFNIIAGMTLPYNGPTGYVNGWYNAETAAICSKSGNNAVITLSDPDVAETWVRGKTIDNLLWTSNEDDSNWRNYGNWATVKNGDTITIDALPVHTSPIPVTIPATANQPEYGSDMGSVRLMNGDTLILEYGALMDTKNLGVTLGALRTSLVVRGEDRGEWILAGPNLKMKEGDGTREQLSGDYYLNKLPWVYMHEISIVQGDNPTISWQNAFPQLTEVLTPESAFAIRVDNKYGKYGINSERYYSKDSVMKHLGQQDVIFTFEGVPYPTPTFSVPAGKWTVITNTTTGNISIADLLNNEGGQAAVWNFNLGSKGNKGSWTTYANAAAAGSVYAIPATAFLYKPTADMTADQVLAYTNYTLSGKYHVTAALDGVPDPTLTLTAANGKYAAQTSVTYNAFISDEETEEPTNNALKVFSSYDGVPDICSYNGGTAYFSRTVNGSTTTVPLGVSATSDMTFTLTAQGAENFKAAVLDDRLTGLSYNLKTQAALEFDIEAGENKDRFFLNLKYDDTLQPTTDIDENTTKNIIVVCNGQILNSISDIDDILSVQLTDMAGRKITRNVNARSDAWELKKFASGVYIAKVTTSSSTKTVKITVK